MMFNKRSIKARSHRAGIAAALLGIALSASRPARAEDTAPPAASPPSSAGDQAASDPKADCEALITAALPFAKYLLTHYGTFHPYGQAMRASGQLEAIGGWNGEEHPPPTDLIRLIKDGFIAAARNGDYKATALLYDVRIALPGTGEKSDAIAVSLNHQGGYSVIVLFPYTLDAGKLTIGAAIARKGEADIFPQP